MADKKQTMLYGLLTSIASKITYDNTESGLTADNVQDAIDEINSNLYINNYTYVGQTILETNKNYTMPYPSGYDSTNCVIISMMLDMGNNRYDSYPNHNLAGGILVSLRTDGIVVFANNNAAVGTTLRLALLKINK